jgi:hypothetical protein
LKVTHHDMPLTRFAFIVKLHVSFGRSPNMFSLKSAVLVLAAVILSSACATRTRHTEGPLQLHLGVAEGRTSYPSLFKSFRDERADEFRTRQRHESGEAYGDADFNTPLPLALMQEIEKQLGERSGGQRLRERLGQSSVVLLRSRISFVIGPSEPQAKQLETMPPGFALVDALIHAPLGGRSMLTCFLEIELEGRKFVGARALSTSGSPPPLNYSTAPCFAQAVSSLLDAIDKG